MAALIPRLSVGRTVEAKPVPADPEPTPEAGHGEAERARTGEALREL